MNENPIIKIMKVVINRLNNIASLDKYAKIYPHSKERYLIWEIVGDKKVDVFGVLIKDKKAKFIDDIVIDLELIKLGFENNETNEKIEGVVELSTTAIMNMLTGKADLFTCEMVHKNVNLYSNRRNHLRSLLYLMFKENQLKLRRAL